MATHDDNGPPAVATGAPLRTVEPQPMTTPSNPYPPSASAPNIGLNLGPESQIPDHPSSMMDVPRPSNNYGQGQVQNQGQEPVTSTMPAPTDLTQLRTQCQLNLREYQALERKRQRPETASVMSADLDARWRSQQKLVLSNLRALQDEIKVLSKQAENHRWRKWLMGGAVASFIPLVRKIFRRGSDKESESSSNDTEYAFKKSKGLLSHIKDSVLGNGSFASMAFFVFAVLYVFQNEVTLRVARTVQKRIRKLASRIEMGDPDIEEKDIKLLQGWRWRVLLW